MVVGIVEVRIIEIIPRGCQARTARQARIGGIGDDPLESDEEEDHPEDYRRVRFHDQLTQHRRLSLLRSAQGALGALDLPGIPSVRKENST